MSAPACRTCGASNELATDAYDADAPELAPSSWTDGDVMVCAICGELSVMDHGRLEAPDDELRAALLANPRIVDVLAAVAAFKIDREGTP